MSRVLIVDPSPQSRGLLATAMKQAGWEVAVAGGGTEAIAAAKSARPDFVLLEHDLTDVDAIAVMKAIRQMLGENTVRVAVMSRVAQKERVISAIKAGACDYIVHAIGQEDKVVRRIAAHVRPLTGSTSAAGPSVADKPPSGPPTRDASASEDLATVRGDAPLTTDRARDMLKGLKPLIAKSALLERIDKATELRALSPTVRQVLALTANSTVSTDDLAKAIKRDQAIAVKILRIANSALYAHGDRVDTVHKAVMRIGTEQIKQAVLNLAVVEQFAGTAAGGRIRSDWFWEHSIGCGLIAAAIARHRGVSTEAVDTMFTAGLLHDIGRVMLLEHEADLYEQVIAWADKLALPLELVEARLLGIDHADLAERVLRSWKFPQDLSTPIALHHLSVANIRHHAPSRAEDTITLALANRLAHASVVGSSGNEAIHDLDDFISALSLEPQAVRDIARRMPEQAADLRLAMLTHTNSGPTDSALDSLRARSEGVRPLIVQTRTLAADAVRMCCERVWPSDERETPNLAIVTVRSEADRTAASAKLRQDEAASGCDGLPVLVLSPTGKIGLDEDVMVSRAFVLAAMPMALTRFVDTAASLTASQTSAKIAAAKPQGVAA